MTANIIESITTMIVTVVIIVFIVLMFAPDTLLAIIRELRKKPHTEQPKGMKKGK